MWNKPILFTVRFVLGAIAATVAKTISAPFERVKIVRQCVDKETESLGLRQTIRFIYRNQGCLSFWNGNLANCIRSVPKFALDMSLKAEIYFLLTELKSFDWNTYTGKLSATILSGSLVGLISTIICYPLDFARTQLSADINGTPTHDWILDCWRSAVKSNGYLGIYRGLWICLFGDVLYRGLKYGFYDGFIDEIIIGLGKFPPCFFHIDL